MREFELIEGEGVAGPFSEVSARTTTMFSCYAFVFENQQRKLAGMYHYPACQISNRFVQATIRRMIEDIQPMILHVVPGGSFADVEVSGRAGARRADIHPLYRGASSPTDTDRERAADPIRHARVGPTALLDMQARDAIPDYDQVRDFLNFFKPTHSILKYYPAALGAWYREAGGGVQVNNNDRSVDSPKRDGIGRLFETPKPGARRIPGVALVAYYGGKVPQ